VEYTTFPGWLKPTTVARRFDELPEVSFFVVVFNWFFII
jgi:hypothetical protein